MVSYGSLISPRPGFRAKQACLGSHGIVPLAFGQTLFWAINDPGYSRGILALRPGKQGLQGSPAAKGGYKAGQTAKARRGPPCAVTPQGHGSRTVFGVES